MPTVAPPRAIDLLRERFEHLPRPGATASHPTRPGVDSIVFALVVALTAAWGLRWLVGGDLPPGSDVTGHLQRTDFALGSLFPQGRLDGWFPGTMLGYQAFLFYGPGLALLVGLVRVASLGAVSTAGAYEVVVVAAYVAVPFAVARLGRSLGLRPSAAAIGGMLALAASSPRGGGIQGAFETGLAAQQVGVPLVVLALSLALDCLGPGPAPARPRLLALVVAALALTHPLSLLFLLLLGPLLVAGAWAAHRVEVRRWPSLAQAAAWSVGLATWWWLPALVQRDLRGPVTSWDLPGIGDHVDMLVTGERGWHGPVGPAVAACVAGTLVIGLISRRRDLLGLAGLPVGALLLVHAAHAQVGMQLPNRGLVFVALLGAPAAGWIVDALASVVLPRTPVAAWGLAMALVVASVGDLEPGASQQQHPSLALERAAAVLAEGVPDGGRFAFVGRGWADLGAPAPERWLAWASGRDTLSSFGPEYATGSGVALDESRPLDPTEVGGWIDRVSDLGVTHLVTTDVLLVPALEASPDVGAALGDPPLWVWEILPAPGRSVGSIVPADEARVLAAEADRFVIETTTAEPADDLPLGLGYSPGWELDIDGRPAPTRRAADGRLAIDLPAGTHVVDLRFVEPAVGPAARGASLLVAAALLLAHRLRRRPMEPTPPPRAR